MLNPLLVTAFLIIIPAVSFSQELESKYTEVGRFVGLLDEVPVEYVGTYNNERDRSSVTIDERTGFTVILAQTRLIASDGSLDNAGIGILISPLITGLPPGADVTVTSDAGFYVASVDFDGRLAVKDLDFSQVDLSFSISGLLVPVIRNKNSEFQRDPDRDPINITGTFSGTPTYRE